MSTHAQLPCGRKRCHSDLKTGVSVPTVAVRVRDKPPRWSWTQIVTLALSQNYRCVDCDELIRQPYLFYNAKHQGERHNIFSYFLKCNTCTHNKQLFGQAPKSGNSSSNSNSSSSSGSEELEGEGRRFKRSRKSFGWRKRWEVAYQQCFRCRCCAKLLRADCELDHEVPLRVGGADTLENCALLCASCHAVKSKRETLWLTRKASSSHKFKVSALPPKHLSMKLDLVSRTKPVGVDGPLPDASREVVRQWVRSLGCLPHLMRAADRLYEAGFDGTALRRLTEEDLLSLKISHRATQTVILSHVQRMNL